jgi:LmbE family N-acetylglucosaminyl deacetylase
MRRARFGIVAAALVAIGSLASSSGAQERGVIALDEDIQGLGVTTRVLMIGAHPDDEDTQLLTWLSRGEHVETAYLSLTRGDGGQNLIGNELGEALGAIRTEELLAARRVDGGVQYFTRAYDFGFSKSADEAFSHWPRDSILRDVVAVVRQFKPHVIISMFSGTPRDGHGHHQVAGILAKESYEAAGDTIRFPAGADGAWTPRKFYRGRYFDPGNATLRMNVGEYNPRLGRSYAEIASISRSQHKSQAFGALQQKGVRWRGITLEDARTGTSVDSSIYSGLRRGWLGLRGLVPRADAALERIDRQVKLLDGIDYLRDPALALPPLWAIHGELVSMGALSGPVTAGATNGTSDGEGTAPGAGERELRAAVNVALGRVVRAITAASGTAIEAEVPRELVAAGDSMPLTITLYNRGGAPLRVALPAAGACTSHAPTVDERGNAARRVAVTVLPDSQVERKAFVCTTSPPSSPFGPWWLADGRDGDVFRDHSAIPAERQAVRRVVSVVLEPADGGAGAIVDVPVVYRRADPVRGDVSAPLDVVPAVAVSLDRAVEYAPANAPLDRQVTVTLRSASTESRDVRVRLQLPAGLTADSVERSATLPAYDAVRSLTFRVRGQLAPGPHTIAVEAASAGERFATGYQAIQYDHIRTRRLFRPSVLTLNAVEVALPSPIAVGYIRGVGDNVPAALEALGIPVTEIDPANLAHVNLGAFTTIVVGPRAYESSDALVAGNARLLGWVRSGGTMVVQYGQYEMTRRGMMPFPITIARPHTRVTDERAAVRVLDPDSPLLRTPNVISAPDFDGWVQERSLYMPQTFDDAYHPVLALNDPGEPSSSGALLVARYGAGTYVYTTLALFRQLPAGVPGAARLFANLIAAGHDGPVQP